MDLQQIFQGGPSDYKWKQLGEYLKGSQLNAGKGIKIENSTSSGSIISAKQPRDIKQSQAPPFSVLSLRKNSSNTYAVQIQEGWVIERKTRYDSSVDAVSFHEVNLGGAAMSTRPRNEISLEHDQFAYVEFGTTNEGFVNTTPTITVASSVPNSTHHQPPSGVSAGAYGSYKVKLFKLTVDNGSPKIIVYQQSDIEHTRLPTFRNVGGERYIHKDWDGAADRYDFRTLKQHEPSNVNYGKVIVDFVNTEDDDQNDAIKFSAIAEKTSPSQIKVNDDNAGTITVRGNNVDGTILWMDCDGDDTTLLDWRDGLITSVGEQTITAGCTPSGSSGDILYHTGSTWVTLAKPSQTNPNGGGYDLTHMGGSTVAPQWTSGLPSANSGDILYYNGSTWVTLAKPPSGNPDGEWFVLAHAGGSVVAPEWIPHD